MYVCVGGGGGCNRVDACSMIVTVCKSVRARGSCTSDGV